MSELLKRMIHIDFPSYFSLFKWREGESLIEVIYSVETFPPHQQKNCLILHLALPRELSFPSSQKTRDRVPGLISIAL